jgi:two-component system, NarL family, invasion response regulator UvrY
VAKLFLPVGDALLELDDFRGHRGAAILQGMDGVSVGFFVHVAKAGDDRLNRLLRLPIMPNFCAFDLSGVNVIPSRHGMSLGSIPMRVLIVDDHLIVASGCRALFAEDPDVDILEASDAESGERAFVDERPDVCVLDINLPGVSGFELARRILARDGSARIIMFSMNDDPIFAARAIEAGVKGYVSKSGDPSHLVDAIHEVGRGGTYLPPALALNIAFAGPAFAHSPLAKLTSREIEILRLLSMGKSLTEIAWQVQVSYKTIANTSSIMRQKLGVRTSAELVRLAIANSLT